MRKQPQVRVFARTAIDEQAINDYLDNIGTSFRCPQHPEALLEVAGRLCYRSWEPGLNPNVTRVRKSNEYIEKSIMASEHHSVLEHISITFLFQDVSRVFTHELVRHRLSAFSQESMRYVRLDDIHFYIPEDIAQDFPHVAAMMEEWFIQNSDVQKQLASMFNLDDPNMTFEKKKYLTSFMRRFAPDGLLTSILWTTNLRNLRHVIKLRTSPAAEVEIREVFNKVYSIAQELYPSVFPTIHADA